MVVHFDYQPGWQSEFEWVVYVGFAICFFLSFGMGANDCANSYGTVIGAGVLKLWHAYVLATIFETLGAAMLGYKVTDTIREGIVDPGIYSVFVQQNSSNHKWMEVDNCSTNSTITGLYNCTELTRAEFLMGELGALTGTAFWLIFAGVFSLPVSATQSVVGATIGFTLVFHGTKGIHVSEIIDIVVSWVSSPLLAGFFSTVFFLIIKFSVFKRANPLEASLNTSPFWFWFTLAVNSFTVFYDGSKYLSFDKITWWQALLISNGIGIVVAIFVWFFGRNMMRKAAIRAHAVDTTANVPAEDWVDTLKKTSKSKHILVINQDFHKQYPEPEALGIGEYHSFGEGVDQKVQPQTANGITNGYANGQNGHLPNRTTNKSRGFVYYLRYVKAPFDEEPRAVKVFNYLQILSACFLAFSHGSNDTANSVGPLVGLFVTYRFGLATYDTSNDPTMEYVILFGALCMLVGLWVMGHRVIKTIGKDLTDITAPSGFAMSLGTAFTVLFASKVGIPVSTTHCMVGAVLFVGIAKSNPKGVSWGVFRNIAFAWLVTTPVAGLVSAGVAWVLAHFVLGTY